MTPRDREAQRKARLSTYERHAREDHRRYLLRRDPPRRMGFLQVVENLTPSFG